MGYLSDYSDYVELAEKALKILVDVALTGKDKKGQIGKLVNKIAGIDDPWIQTTHGYYRGEKAHCAFCYTKEPKHADDCLWQRVRKERRHENTRDSAPVD